MKLVRLTAFEKEIDPATEALKDLKSLERCSAQAFIVVGNERELGFCFHAIIFRVGAAGTKCAEACLLSPSMS